MRKRGQVERRTAAAWQQLELVNSWIRLSDAKLATLLAFVGVAGGGVYAVVLDACRPAWLIPLAGLASVFLAGAAASAFMGLMPVRRFVAPLGREVIFYRALHAKYRDGDSYVDAFHQAMDDDELGPNLLRQAHINSGIADRKFVLTTCSSVLLMAGLAALAGCAVIRVIG